ncbi:hypothetical protein PF005_g15225 [Phytophthora fragariae]|uniref:Uncharacterized protein n=1 Tax=Phytophthora fragariae TaxID=53985 RepID=A0A6A3XER4_9STRA|nr:hypothetical protein PF003_g17677 [Phytophthora fragariae]KAE8942384.1 hypothetical protein PF009_g7863 [Phytophthora fragariae]KAE8996458.1 hypothetical protein PF011_g15884 [Phytophthora fragariae]KAE9099294.1 hypothetical protein PF010_g15248 [Phytophthora fragariae]KAE9124382.1 hypothetical protein PF007_g6739 [Phytophthora fragariae]
MATPPQGAESREEGVERRGKGAEAKEELNRERKKRPQSEPPVLLLQVWVVPQARVEL